MAQAIHNINAPRKEMKFIYFNTQKKDLLCVLEWKEENVPYSTQQQHQTYELDLIFIYIYLRFLVY